MFPHVLPLSHSQVTVLCTGPSKWAVGSGGREGGCGEISKAVIFMSDPERTTSQGESGAVSAGDQVSEADRLQAAAAAHAVARPPMLSVRLSPAAPSGGPAP